MEENGNNVANEQEQPDSSKTRVGFPEANPPKKPKSKRKIIAVILVILLLLGAVAWYIFGTSGLPLEESETSPTPTDRIEVTSTPKPTEVEIERNDVKIQVQNGTGIPGSAGDLQKELEKLGYKDIKTGNAANYDNQKTTVLFDKSLSQDVKDEITEKLEDLFSDVETEEKTMSAYDVIIVTGYPIGHTATKSPTKSPTSTVLPSVSGTGSITPTRSASISPTKTPTPTP